MAIGIPEALAQNQSQRQGQRPAPKPVPAAEAPADEGANERPETIDAEIPDDLEGPLVQVPRPRLKPEAMQDHHSPHGTAFSPTSRRTVLRSAADRANMIAALRTLDQGQVEKAHEIARQIRDPIATKLIDWHWLQASQSGAPFERIAAFIDANPDWPAREALLRRADEALDDSVPDQRVISWYQRYPPNSGLAQFRLAEVFARQGRDGDARTMLRDAWINSNIALKDEAEIMRRYGEWLTPADHAARLDRLLWDSQIDTAKRMLPRVDSGRRAVAEARIALLSKAGNVDTLLDRVPPELRDDGGLMYNRMRWKREKGQETAVEEILHAAPEELGRAEKWWTERQFRARRAISEGRVTDAYKLAAQHGLREGRSYVEAEWLAGWIALRLLNEPKTAIDHFKRLHTNVRFPVSLSRAAYWAGRGFEALGQNDEAADWYARAAAFPTTYYGQLAIARSGMKSGSGEALALPIDPLPTQSQREAFDRRDVVRAARILAEIDRTDRLRSFILRIEETAKAPEERVLATTLARDVDRIDLAVAASKRAAQSGVVMVNDAFPLIQPLLPNMGTEPALVHAVSRQESEFNAHAISPVGARGLMQLMPATAKEVSKWLKVKYNVDLLTDDADYNARLGSRYLSTLIDNWDGNLVLTLASYNAGEGRARKWIREWGDPRRPDIDPIDWVELIPFQETRNYVQRVLESLQVYRQILRPGGSVAVNIEGDLRGRKRQSCAGC